MNTSYHKLFAIELLHEYFMDGKCTDLEIMPAEGCSDLFNGAGLQWRNSEHRLITLMKENDIHGHFLNNPDNIPPDRLYRKYYGKNIFRFYLKLKNAAFYNYTNLAITGKKIAYFNNLSKNKINAAGSSLLYLSKRISDYANGHAYVPGDLVMQPTTDNVYEAIKKHTGAAVAELNDPALWIPRQKLQFPKANDLIACTGANYLFTLPAAVTKATIEIFEFDFNIAAPDFTIPVGEPETQYFEKPSQIVNVDMSTLKSGRYRLKVNAETATVYYDPQLSQDNIFGMVEIFNQLPEADDYSFFTDDEIIRERKYTLLFPARNVLWKYTRKDNKAQSITDTGVPAHVFNLNGNDFVSAAPIPLSEAAITTLKLQFNTTDHELSPLPNPPISRLGKCNQAGYDYLCAEMYLNY